VASLISLDASVVPADDPTVPSTGKMADKQTFWHNKFGEVGLFNASRMSAEPPA
jgi:hypothetical protein